MNRRDRQEFNDLQKRAAAAEAQLQTTREVLARQWDDFTAERAVWRAERQMLLERIQRPEHEPVPVPVDGPPRKLHYSEDDELDGLSVQEVAEQAGLAAPHLYAIGRVDEIAHTEGVE